MSARRAIAVGFVVFAAGAGALASPTHHRRYRVPNGSSGGSALQYDGSAISVQLPVGQMQTIARPITNSGTTDVTLAAAQIVSTSGSGSAWTFAGYDYACSGTMSCTLSPGQLTDATPTFTPPDLGFYSADLMISADDGETVFLELSGVGLGARISGPASLPLGGTPVTTTLSGSIHLDNSGNIAQSFTATVQGDPEITVGGSGSIDPSSGADLPVTCTPSAVAAYGATVHVATPGALTADLDVAVTCSGTDGVLRASPSVVDFGEVRIGVGATRTVMLTRVGSGAALELDDPAFDDPAPDDIAVGAPSSATVATSPATTFDLTVSADPGAPEGPQHGHIEVTAHEGGVDSHAPVDVTARLVTAAYSVPETLDAGTYCLGEAPRPTNATLVSTGTATLMLQAPAFTGGAAHFALTDVLPVQYPATLAPGGTAMVQVTPVAQTAAGTVSDTLVWTTDVAAAPSAQIAVTAAFVADGAAISPQHVDFGSVGVTQPSAVRTITIENCATSVLMLSPASISTTAFADVSLAPLPAMLAPSELATIQVQFTPVRAGGAMAVLTVDSSKGALTVTLVGAGVGADSADTDKTSFYACRAVDAPTGLALFGVGLFAYRRRRPSRR
ncbi:MAG TPA: choice-of-anchor D domain-containing protein [Kofleriaceae bacterium]|jgi:hypothetical protein